MRAGSYAHPLKVAPADAANAADANAKAKKRESREGGDKLQLPSRRAHKLKICLLPTTLFAGDAARVHANTAFVV